MWVFPGVIQGVNMAVLLCADAVHRHSGRGGPAAHRRGEVAPPDGGERTEHPEGGQTHLQRHGAVRRRSRPPPLHFCFSVMFLFFSVTM